MKTTLLLIGIFVCLGVSGQVNVGENHIHASHSIIFGGDTILFEYVQEDMPYNPHSAPPYLNLKPCVVELIGDWQEYKQDCYNDSTRRSEEIITEHHERPRLRWEYYDYYTHKQPTFEGFMEWLEKKYRKE